MRGSEIKIDISKMKKLRGPMKWTDQMAFSVTERGNISLNTRLLNELKREGEYVKINIYVTEDMKIIGLLPEENPEFKFPKTGIMRYAELARTLEKKGYTIPAKYIVEKNVESGMWIGVLQEVAEAPKLKEIGKKHEKRNVKV